MAAHDRKVGDTMDERAFEAAVLRLEKKLYHTALGVLWNDADAADALQETVFRAWRHLPSLREEARFDAWIMRILINECRNIQRRGRRRMLPLDEAAAVQAPVEDGFLREALRGLPEKYRLPLILHHVDGYGIAEIASALRLPQTTVRGRLHVGRGKLKALLEEAER